MEKHTLRSCRQDRRLLSRPLSPLHFPFCVCVSFVSRIAPSGGRAGIKFRYSVRVVEQNQISYNGKPYDKEELTLNAKNTHTTLFIVSMVGGMG